MHPLVDQLGLPDPGPLDHLALPDQPGLLAGRLAPRAQVSLDRLDRLVKPDQVALLGLVLVLPDLLVVVALLDQAARDPPALLV